MLDRRALLVSLLGLASVLLTRAADAPAQPQPAEAYQMYSGTVVEAAADKLTVSRTVPGKPAETRTFLIKPETKLEGKPKPSARVTVGYRTTDEGDVAVRIIVRPSSTPPAPKK